MTKIIPIRDLKDTSKISEMCNSSDSPVFITKNGYEDMVIMSTKVYDSIKGRGVSYPIVEPQPVYMSEPLRIYTIEQIKEILEPVFREFKVKSAILFGSYAKGIANSRSDIDIVVDSGLRGLKFFGLLDAVAQKFNIPVDLIDTVDIEKGSRIDQEIQKYGVEIYGEKDR